MSFLYVFGVTAGFIGNKKWTFSHQGTLLNTGIKYFTMHFFGYLLNFMILLIFVDRFGYPHQVVQAAAIIVVALFLFISFRFFVFPQAGINKVSVK